jgi:hypothetical protein
MTSYYRCSCGYCTKNSENASFHDFDTHRAFERPSAFEDKAGFIARIVRGETTEFFKWYEDERSIADIHDKYTLILSNDCDRDFVRLQTKARHMGLVCSADPVVSVCTESADDLFCSK